MKFLSIQAANQQHTAAPPHLTGPVVANAIPAQGCRLVAQLGPPVVGNNRTKEPDVMHDHTGWLFAAHKKTVHKTTGWPCSTKETVAT